MIFGCTIKSTSLGGLKPVREREREDREGEREGGREEREREREKEREREMLHHSCDAYGFYSSFT